MDTKSIADVRNAISGNPLVSITKDSSDALVFLSANRVNIETSPFEPITVLVDLLQFSYVLDGDVIVSEDSESMGVFKYTADEALTVFPSLDDLVLAFNATAIEQHQAPPPVAPPAVAGYPQVPEEVGLPSGV